MTPTHDQTPDAAAERLLVKLRPCCVRCGRPEVMKKRDGTPDKVCGMCFLFAVFRDNDEDDDTQAAE